LLYGLVLSASPVGARQLELSLEQSIRGDSNLFRSSSVEVADGSYEIAPSIAIVEHRETLDYRLFYKPSYEVFFRSSSLDGFDHEALGEIEWRPTAFDTLLLKQTYTNTRRLREFSTDDPLADLEDVLLDRGRERVARARTTLGYRHAFTEFWSGEFEGEFYDVDYDLNTNADQRAFSGLLGLNYSVQHATTLGAEVLGRLRQFAQRSNVEPGSDSTVVAGALVLRHEFFESFDLEIHIGATYLHQQRDDPADFQTTRFQVLSNDTTVLSRVLPSMPAGAPFCDSDIFGIPNFDHCPFAIVDPAQLPTNSDVVVSAAGLSGDSADTVFASGSAQLNKRWRNSILTLDFTRGEAGNSRDSSSNIRDTLSLNGVWKPVREWRWRAEAAWAHWKTASDFGEFVLPANDSSVPTMVGGSSNFAEVGTTLVATSVPSRRETQQAWVLFSGRYYFADNLSLEGRFRYVYQQRESATSTSSFNAYSGALGLVYSFDPLLF